ncbi:MAG: hypothetical protein ACI4NM_09405 [Bullifex sp.]
MKKSVIVTYIVSALLIVLSFVLVALAVSSAYTVETYRVGRMVYTSSSYVYGSTARILDVFSRMSFFLGVAGVITATVVQVFGPEKKKTSEDPHCDVKYEECHECDASLPDTGAEN